MLSIPPNVNEHSSDAIQNALSRSYHAQSSRHGGAMDSDLFSQFMRRSIKWVILATVIGLAMAWYVATHFAKDTYYFTGQLRLEPSSVGFPFLVAPSTVDYTRYVDSPQTIRTLHKEFDIQGDESATADSITVEAYQGSSDMMIEMQGESPEKVKAILNELLVLVSEQSREIRDVAIEKHLAQFKLRTDALEDQEKEAEQKYDALCKKYNTHDLEAQFKANENDRAATNGLVAHRTIVCNLLRETIDDIKQTIVEARGGNIPRDEQDLLDEEVKQSIDTSRHAILQDKLVDHRQREAARVKLSAKQSELQRLKTLLARDLVTQAEVQEVESQVELLTLESNGDETINRLEGSISKIRDKMDSNDYLASSARAKYLARLADKLENKQQALAIAENELRDFSAHLKYMEAEYERLVDVTPKIRDFKDEMDGFNQQRQILRQETDAIKQLLATDGHTLTVNSEAYPSMHSVKNNQKKMLVAGFGAGSLLLLIPGFLIELFRITPSKYERLASKHGLPIIGRIDRKSASRFTGGTTSRVLASRIQRLNLPVGSSIALVSTGRQPCPTGMLYGAASQLAEEGSRVLIVETIGKTGLVPLPGEHTTEQVQEQTLEHGTTGPVDRLIINDPSLLCNAMSNQVWDELSASIRAYRYVLIGGVSSQDPSVASLVSAGADAVVVVSLERDAASLESTNLINDLIDFDARFLGAVIST
ncbi:hypothetical protein CA13_33800 [Planctomycetes bacterium CA13]|uniref:Uncharacterized protein n=1 Tax=Novipirellula herctigrandis TaxID=2527986 RepID=A0A5C5Z3Y6_9BACT|nr:hypothetical protein CA13_33800 [Planctomycetes bacterium CA13]